MRKILVLLAVLAVAAFGRQAHVYCGDGTETPDTWDQSTGDAYFAGDVEVDTDCDFDGDVDIDGDLDVDNVDFDGDLTLPDGAIDNPSWEFESDPDNGPYLGAADSIYWTINGVHVGTIDGTGWSGDIATGDVGTVTPGLGTFTDIMGSGDFYYGNDPGNLHTGYRRTNTIKYIDDFSVGNDADLAVRWDLTNVVGAGTNTETVVDGWNNLVTGGAGGPDMESTRSNGLHLYAAYEPRLECVVELTAIAAGQNFYFGFWGAANDYAEIIHEPATSANWLIRVDDTGGATTHDSGIAAVAATPTKLEIWVTAAGVVRAAIDDVNVAVAGLDPMTLTAKYVEWRVLDVAAAAHTVAVDYYIQEQLKQQ